jgi:heterodisulfide reductase subunit A-like polyferredoxin
MRPKGADTELAKALGITADAYGFAQATDALRDSGVFLAGAVSEPMDIEETAIKAIATASKVASGKEAAR